MFVPIDYRGEVGWPNERSIDARKDRDVFLYLAALELRGLGLQRVYVQSNRISFGGGTPQSFSRWNMLTLLDEGEIEVIELEGRLAISYRLSFKTFLLYLPIACFITLASWVIFGHAPRGAVILVGIMFLAWTAIMSLNCRTAARELMSQIKQLATRI